MSPWVAVMEYVFTGFCLIIFVSLIWVIRHTWTIHGRAVQAIKDNANMLRMISVKVDDRIEAERNIHDELVKRPCLAVKDEDQGC